MSQVPAVAGEREFDCVIEPQQIVKLASPAVGMIARLDVDRGDFVQQGQVVGKIDDAKKAGRKSILLLVERQGDLRFVAVRLDQS